MILRQYLRSQNILFLFLFFFCRNSSLNLPAPALHGTGLDKAGVFVDRYTVLHQRTLRHDLFTPPVLGAIPEQDTKKFQVHVANGLSSLDLVFQKVV